MLKSILCLGIQHRLKLRYHFHPETTMTTLPLVAVVGTTGVGKSRLAVELALALNDSIQDPRWKRARVINADAMQVYRGLDILTNKVTEEEKMGVEHCLMAFKNPGDEYVVGEWVRDATQIVCPIRFK